MTYDHEHPCPSGRCLEFWREFEEIPPDADCCICWARELAKTE